MITRNNITKMAYNVQTTVDAKNNILIDYKLTDINDSKAMCNMLQRAKSILRTNEFTALYDKGYHTGSEFKQADDLGIDVMVAIPGLVSQAPDPSYNVEKFIYFEDDDYYICPQGKRLTTPRTWHKIRTYQFKRYTTKVCKLPGKRKMYQSQMRKRHPVQRISAVHQQQKKGPTPQLLLPPPGNSQTPLWNHQVHPYQKRNETCKW